MPAAGVRFLVSKLRLNHIRTVPHFVESRTRHSPEAVQTHGVLVVAEVPQGSQRADIADGVAFGACARK